ncbi:hypothetical protein I33_3378 [Bacillus subtilis subsp. subtilis str. RO-NN-1]|nr:hypothetical protein I33_3378 [Bacillus subtilis subsp. subtilis str. RO-NN-1]
MNQSLHIFAFYCTSAALDAAKTIWREIAADETKASFQIK